MSETNDQQHDSGQRFWTINCACPSHDSERCMELRYGDRAEEGECCECVCHDFNENEDEEWY